MESERDESPVSDARPVEVCNSIRERTIAENSMVLLLQGLQGEVTTVDLRNESTAQGRVVNVDAFMNIRLEEVLVFDECQIHITISQNLLKYLTCSNSLKPKDLNTVNSGVRTKRSGEFLLEK
uniref:Sm domain-containing protein n=1 Tax=Mastacembelus armatus TaxID=205130 RepID=A0A7N8WYP7_9TELE